MCVALAFACLGPFLAAGGESPVARHPVASPYQPEPVTVEVLAPDRVEPGKHYPALYILPVESGATGRWGNGMEEALNADIANRFGVFCIYPSFSATPWFADHPDDPALQQESHFIKVVIPWVEKHYPVEKARKGRFLIGFSKSGYGAVMLLLRHPEMFERAAAWDAPIDKTQPDQFRMIDVFGTADHFANYAIPNLVPKCVEALKDAGHPRLVLMPNRDGDHAMHAVHAQLLELGIPHIFEYTGHIKHHWNSGWFPRAAELVLTGGDSASTP